MEAGDGSCSSPPLATPLPETAQSMDSSRDSYSPRPNQVSTVVLYGVPIVSLVIDGIQRLCLAQISNTLLKEFSYNEIHNRRVALGITCVQCTPVQLEILRRAGAMPISSRRCGMITKREAERLCKSFLGDNAPPQLPDNFVFEVMHECAWGCRGGFVPSRYNSSRAKCIKCIYCSIFFSPNKFVFHSHRLAESKYVQPDAANFNSWRRHIRLYGEPPEEVIFAWEDVKAMFNGGTRKRLMSSSSSSSHKMSKQQRISPPPLGKSPPMTGPSLKHSDMGSYGPYLGGITPLPPHYPTPSPQKGLDMRQSFVDYLWNSRGGIPPLGFPYPLSWPKRPLPSLPGLSIANGEASFEGKDHYPDLLRAAPASAFTPVSATGISLDDQAAKHHSHQDTSSKHNTDDAEQMDLDDRSHGKDKFKHFTSRHSPDKERNPQSSGDSFRSETTDDQYIVNTRKVAKVTEIETSYGTRHGESDEHGVVKDDEEAKDPERGEGGTISNTAPSVPPAIKAPIKVCEDSVLKKHDMDDVTGSAGDVDSVYRSEEDEDDIDVTDDCSRTGSPHQDGLGKDSEHMRESPKKSPSPPALSPAVVPHHPTSNSASFTIANHLQQSGSTTPLSRGPQPTTPPPHTPPPQHAQLSISSSLSAIPHSLPSSLSPIPNHNPSVGSQLSPGFPAGLSLPLTSIASSMGSTLPSPHSFSSIASTFNHVGSHNFPSLNLSGTNLANPGSLSSSNFASSFSSNLVSSTQSLLTEEDPRLRLLFLREFEARRRMELEMARVKLAHPSVLHPALHHPHHHPQPPPHLSHHHTASPFHHQAALLGSPLSSPLSSHLTSSLTSQLGSPMSSQMSPPHHPHALGPPTAPHSSPNSPHSHHMAAAALSSLQHHAHHSLSKEWMETAAAAASNAVSPLSMSHH